MRQTYTITLEGPTVPDHERVRECLTSDLHFTDRSGLRVIPHTCERPATTPRQWADIIDRITDDLGSRYRERDLIEILALLDEAGYQLTPTPQYDWEDDE